MALVPDDHDPQSDGHYIELRIVFQETIDPVQGEHPLEAGNVEVHVHHVSEPVFVTTMLQLAREAVVRSMMENMFRDDVPEEVRRAAANMMATKFLVAHLESHSDDNGMTGIKVPDDASELFGDRE